MAKRGGGDVLRTRAVRKDAAKRSIPAAHRTKDVYTPRERESTDISCARQTNVSRSHVKMHVRGGITNIPHTANVAFRSAKKEIIEGPGSTEND